MCMDSAVHRPGPEDVVVRHSAAAAMVVGEHVGYDPAVSVGGHR